ncbi:MAG: aldehyde dehydrogenase family protein, partial [Arenicellales bacterium]
MKTYQYFAANAWHDPSTGSYIESENPATGEVWAKVPDCNAEDVHRAVAAAKSAYDESPWGKLHPAERGRVLRRIGDTISRHAQRL